MRTTKPTTRGSAGGMVLLEVVLATGLFAMAATGAVIGLHSCFQGLKTMRLQSRASNLAISLAAKVQTGQVPPENDGPNEYEDDESLIDWTWEIVTEDVELDPELGAPPMTRVQVVITNVPTGYVYSTLFLMPAPPEIEGDEEFAGGLAP